MTIHEATDRSLRRATVFQHGNRAGELKETRSGWEFVYDDDYDGFPVSLTLPVRREPYSFDRFPPFFDGLLPEGVQLDTLLRKHKIDRKDHFRQLVIVGEDLVGSVTVKEL